MALGDRVVALCVTERPGICGYARRVPCLYICGKFRFAAAAAYGSQLVGERYPCLFGEHHRHVHTDLSVEGLHSCAAEHGGERGIKLAEQGRRKVKH